MIPAPRPTAKSVCDFIASLTLREGYSAGKRFPLERFQRQWIKQALFGAAKTSLLVVPRGAGKSTLLGGIAAAVLHDEGPLRGAGEREVVVVASSAGQGQIIFKQLRRLLNFPNGRADKQWRVSDSNASRMLLNLESGNSCRVISSDSKRAHGLQYDLCLADECQVWPEATSDEMFSVLQTAQGKRDSRLLCIGTMPVCVSTWWGRNIERGSTEDLHVTKYHAPGKELRLSDVRRAYPFSLDAEHRRGLLEAIKQELKQARRDPVFRSQFENLRLNRGTAIDGREMLCLPDEWARTEGEQPPRSGPMLWSLDAGGCASHTAMCAAWPHTGRFEVVGYVGSEPDLKTLGERDGVGDLWQRCEARGELVQCDTRVPDLKRVFADACSRWNDAPQILICDRYRAGEIRDGLQAVGVQVPLEFRSLGWHMSGIDDTDFRAALMAEPCAVKTGDNLYLHSSVAGAVVVRSIAGQRRLAVATQNGRKMRQRTDGVQCLIWAVSTAWRGMRQQAARQAQMASMSAEQLCPVL